MRHPRSWLLLCALHGVGSMLLWWAQPGTLERMTWRPDVDLHTPWTLWSSAWVYMDTAQLIGHQVMLGVLAAFAWVVRPPWTSTLAWLLAWPLAQGTLSLWPQVGYSIGLSGVLHAGWTVLAVQLLLGRIELPRARRWGVMLAVALVIKLGLERAWDHPVVWDSGNDRSLVQASHLAGAVWGLLLAALTGWLPTGRGRTRTTAAPEETVHP
jgi:hypothetical protein